jgi:hypothetical protein
MEERMINVKNESCFFICLYFSNLLLAKAYNHAPRFVGAGYVCTGFAPAMPVSF